MQKFQDFGDKTLFIICKGQKYPSTIIQMGYNVKEMYVFNYLSV